MSKVKEMLTAELENKALEQNIIASNQPKWYTASLYKYENIIDLDFLEYVRKELTTIDQLTIFEAIEWYLAKEKQEQKEERNNISVTIL